jgi:HK97 family phage major capsid protein
MASEIEKALEFYGGARELAKVLKTGGGEIMNFPQNNDTTNAAVIVGENVQIGEQDTVFTTKPLGSYKYNSQTIRVPIELIQDSSFNIMSYIAEISGERMGRGTNTHFTVGTGTGQPEGFMVGSTDSGIVTAGATTITFDNLIELEHSIDIAYRRKGAAFTFNDATLKLLKKIKDSDGQYIWNMGDVKIGAPNTIMGYKYVVNNDIAAPAASVDSVAFGDFSKFLIRDVAGQRIVRFTEKYADYDQVGFTIFSRHDSMVLDAGTNPIKYMTQGA